MDQEEKRVTACGPEAMTMESGMELGLVRSQLCGERQGNKAKVQTARWQRCNRLESSLSRLLPGQSVRDALMQARQAAAATATATATAVQQD